MCRLRLRLATESRSRNRYMRWRTSGRRRRWRWVTWWRSYHWPASRALLRLWSYSCLAGCCRRGARSRSSWIWTRSRHHRPARWTPARSRLPPRFEDRLGSRLGLSYKLRCHFSAAACIFRRTWRASRSNREHCSRSRVHHRCPRNVKEWEVFWASLSCQFCFHCSQIEQIQKTTLDWV